MKQYLTSHGVKEGLWFDPDGQHAQAMVIGAKGMRRIFDWLKDEPKEVVNIMDSGNDQCTIPNGDSVIPLKAP